MLKRIKKLIAHLTFERILAFILLFSTITALIYRFYRFDFFTIIIALVSSLVVVTLLGYVGLFFAEAESDSSVSVHIHFGQWFWVVTAGAGLAVMMFVLWSNRSNQAIVTPWEVLPAWLFVVYFLVVLSVFHILRTARSGLWLATGASFLVIPITYSLGYGYDFFIHEASMREIISQGVILPKTNYYFGQYSLVLIFDKLLHLPYSIVHLWLVPALSAPILPWLIIKNTANFSERVGWFLLLLFPFSFLTFTTPQNLGLLLLLMEIILLTKPTKNNLLLSVYLVLFNLTIHPISAIPGLTILIMTYFLAHQVRNRIIFFSSALLPLSIPLLLLLTRAASLTGFQPLEGLFSPLTFSLPTSENVILNTAYSYYFNLPLTLLGLVAVGYLVNRKKLGSLIANVGLSLGLVATVVLMQFIRLQNVIAYEQADYARRLLLIAVLMVVPVIVLLLIDFVKAVMTLEYKYQMIWWVFLAGVMTTSFYVSYPRHDNYFNSRGLSVSQGDIEAVRYIQTHSAGEDYVVLANQQVSAASLREYGFAHYYQGNFYYPIPTTNPLYQHYLDMVYERPSRQTAEQAMRLAGVPRVYFVLNKYWLNFPKTLEEAKLTADSYQDFANKSVYVFVYNLPLR